MNQQREKIFPLKIYQMNQEQLKEGKRK